MTDATQPETRFTVVVPAFNAEATLGRCLRALLASGFPASAVLVVDDASTDGTAEVARSSGVRVLRSETSLRPARARNRGAEATGAEVLVFVDADVVVHPGLREALAGHFARPDLTAVFGAYDDAPASPGLVSRYRNLLHAYTHLRAAGPAETFWSGIGAVRRAAFEQAGGFDAAWEDIEDVELGLRLTASGGRILLDPALRGPHMKRGTLRSMMRVDCLGRAVPWTRLLRSGRIGRTTLNAGLSHRISAASVALALPCAALGLWWTPALWAAGAAGAVFVAATAGFLLYLARTQGPLFALAASPAHAAHYAAALAGYLRARVTPKAHSG